MVVIDRSWQWVGDKCMIMSHTHKHLSKTHIAIGMVLANKEQSEYIMQLSLKQNVPSIMVHPNYKYMCDYMLRVSCLN